MLIRYIFKNMRRSSLTNVLFCLLLTLTGALFALAAGLWYSVYSSEQDLENNITTIAVPDLLAIRRYANNYIIDNKITSYETEWETLTIANYGDSFFGVAAQYMQIDILNEISEKLYRTDLMEMDDRRIYGAYSPDIASIPLRLQEVGTIERERFVENAPQSVAAFIVTCESVEETYEWTYSALTRTLIANFVVEQDIYLHGGRNRSRTVTAYFPYANPDGTAPVEESKRYAVMGYRYSQGNFGATWYWALPHPNKNLVHGLLMNVLSFDYSETELSVATRLDDIQPETRVALQRFFGITADSLPISIVARTPKPDAALGHEGLTWFELSGTLEEALESPQGEQIKAALSVAEISHNSLQLLTTNDINSILRFNQRTNKITHGRAFSEREIENGAQVCVISEQLAELNGLSVGDILPLQVFPIALNQIQMGGESAWQPTPYHPSLPLTSPLEYRIVGIYQGITQEMNDHAVSPDTVIIPASSFSGFENGGGGLDEPYLASYRTYSPPLLHTVIVPNGEVSRVRSIIDGAAEDYSMFFRFYDQGYSVLKPVLSNLRYGLTWILALSAVCWCVAAIMFSLFYVARKKQETALLLAIGVSKRRRVSWVMIQCAVVIIIAQCVVLGTTTLFYDDILGASVTASRSFTESYRDYRLSEMDESGGLQLTLPLDRTRLGLLLAITTQTAALLAISAHHAAKRKRELGVRS